MCEEEQGKDEVYPDTPARAVRALQWSGSAVVPPKTATSSPVSPCTPTSLGAGTGLWEWGHLPTPSCHAAAGNTGSFERGNVDKKREFKEQELRILHSALVLRAEESVLAWKGESGFESGLAEQGCGGTGTMAGLCWG